MNETASGSTAASHRALRLQEVEAFRAAFEGRGYALLGVAVLVGILSAWPGPLFIWALLLLFFLNGYLSYRIAASSRGRLWHQYAVVLFDFALLTFTLIYPNPLSPVDVPPQVSLRFGNFIYFFILLSGLAYIYNARLVIWGGISGAICWLAGVAWLLSRPGAAWRQPANLDAEGYLQLTANPGFIDIGVRIQEVGVFLLTAGLLALGVTRIRALAVRQVEAAGQRANLARYFPRQTADFLAEKSNPFAEPREMEATVMFTDLVGFTTWSEAGSAVRTIDYLRKAHGLVAETVFRWNGTLDKFIGDGAMATFGTPSPSGRDAVNALSAAIELANAFEAWRRSVEPESGGDLRLSIGLQFGRVVIGDVGSADRLEFATLGDVVNVASRLEAATREVGCRVLIGEALVTWALTENAEETRKLLKSLEKMEAMPIRGRTARSDVYCYR